jgi:hypothetical protein
MQVLQIGFVYGAVLLPCVLVYLLYILREVCALACNMYTLHWGRAQHADQKARRTKKRSFVRPREPFVQTVAKYISHVAFWQAMQQKCLVYIKTTHVLSGVSPVRLASKASFGGLL